MSNKKLNLDPLHTFFEEEIGTEDMATYVNDAIYNYSKLALSCDKDLVTAATGEDLYFLRLLYERLVEVCKKNNICR